MKKILPGLLIILAASTAGAAETSIVKPTSDESEAIRNKCSIRAGRVENLEQVSCYQELLGRLIFEKNRPVMQVVIETYRQASPEGRKQFETSFIEACSQQRRNADTWGTDVGCGAYLTGLLNAGLPRDENGNFPGRDNPPMSAEAIASLALQIKLGTHDGQNVILDLSTRAETDGVVMAQYLESTQGVAVRCSKNLLSYDYGSQKELAQWAFKTPGTAIEKAALQALCGG